MKLKNNFLISLLDGAELLLDLGFAPSIIGKSLLLGQINLNYFNQVWWLKGLSLNIVEQQLFFLFVEVFLQ